MMRAFAAAVLAALALAAPAQALSGPPTVLDFEGLPDNSDPASLYPGSGARLDTEGCGTVTEIRAAAVSYADCGVVPDGHNGGKSLAVPNGTLDITFSAGQDSVAMWVSAEHPFDVEGPNDQLSLRAWSDPDRTEGSELPPIPSVDLSGTAFGRQVFVTAPPGGPAIRSLSLSTDGVGGGDRFHVDDITGPNKGKSLCYV